MHAAVSSHRLAPGPIHRVPLAFVARLRRRPLEELTAARARWGDLVRFQVGPWVAHLVVHPRDVKHVLQDNHQNYRKGTIIHSVRVLIGDGLFASEGEHWRRQRRLVQPAFHRQRIAGLVDVMTDATAAALDRWARYAEAGRSFDVWLEMRALTLGIVGRALFGLDLSDRASAVADAMEEALDFVNHRASQLLPLPLGVPLPRHRRFLRARAKLDEVVYAVIRARRADAGTADALAMLLAARDPDTGEGMSDEQLRDEIMTLVLAGHETTATALTWGWWLLARHPDVEARLRAEVGTVLQGRRPTVADLPGLAYTRMVVDEVLRLYPPLFFFGRQAIADDVLDGCHVPAGSWVTICPYLTHRHPGFWARPDAFDPEHFAPAAVAARPRYAFYPFGGGPRQCLGADFATLELSLILAMTVQRYRVHVVPGHPVEPRALVTLHPRHGVLVTLSAA